MRLLVMKICSQDPRPIPSRYGGWRSWTDLMRLFSSIYVTDGTPSLPRLLVVDISARWVPAIAVVLYVAMERVEKTALKNFVDSSVMQILRHCDQCMMPLIIICEVVSRSPLPSTGPHPCVCTCRYSSGLRTLLGQLLKKDPHSRPSTGAVLRRALIKDKIGRFLSEAQVRSSTWC